MENRTKVGFVSLGCPKNLVDTEVMIGIAAKNNFLLVANEQDADVVIINTCCFIKQATEESNETIEEFSKLKSEGKIKKLIVAGCLPQRFKEELAGKYPLVDKFVGSSDFVAISEYISGNDTGEKVTVTKPEFIYDADSPRVNSLGKGNAYVKIAEGCSEQCSFCIVPQLRGKARSREIKDIVKEVKNLAAGEIKEVNLIAQNLTAYGKDLYGKSSLAKLLKELCAVDGIEWIRLIYNYPKDFSDELIDVISAEEKICKYVDIPLQHINDDILKAMRRGTTSAEIRTLLDKLKKQVKGLVLRSSFIVGFPGETESEFNELSKFIKEYEFDKIVVFPYSQEDGSSAYKLGDDISSKTKEIRYERINKIKKTISLKSNKKLKGEVFPVLVENIIEENEALLAVGRFYGQAPDVDGQVYFGINKEIAIGKFVNVKIVNADTYDLFGQLVD